MDLGQIVILICGILLGYGIAKPRETARTIRGLLGGLGRSADRANRMYGGEMRDPLRPMERDRDHEDEDDRPRRTVVTRKRRYR